MQNPGNPQPAAGVEAVRVDEVVPVAIGPGCLRRDLPSREGVRIWVVDMAPGSMWPHVDQHDAQGEDVYVASGTLIDGERAYEAGSYLSFGPHSRHQPRTETGVRLFGFNLLGRAAP
ncbi:cupin domain-containing protein [Luteimonas sp. RD2P54]|uniref:Cupin domain-containing protein n=1 Tax=Luteimonas endophytica TaxID=3042023 RepID=A0ABT6J9Y6_9GAMM|nr:cupin domain-containing protein [Luteimonas endophytica]MDH5823635.1 cupin domain-containing protein [Luteimonas endophytica]